MPLETMERLVLKCPQQAGLFGGRSGTDCCELGYPVVIRPAYTMGGPVSAYNGKSWVVAARVLPPVGQVLVEESVLGCKELNQKCPDKNR